MKAFLVSVLCFLGVYCKPSQAEEACQIVGWVPYWAAEEGLASARRNADLLTDLSLFRYYLDKRGRVAEYDKWAFRDVDTRDWQARGVRVFALVANLTESDGERWSSKRVKRVINSAKRRERHIQDLVDLAVDGGYDGINIDYELLDESLRQSFTLFIKQLGSALRAQNKQLAVAIHPPVDKRSVRAGGAWGQSINALALGADQLHIMSYGEHYAGSQPGSAASPQWLSGVYDRLYTMGVLENDNIYFGLPLYAERWRKKGSAYVGLNQDLTYRQALNKAERKGYGQHWDEQTQSPYFANTQQSDVIYFDDAKSIGAKVNLLHDQRNHHRFALWRLGGEDPDIWQAFNFCKSGHHN